MKILIIGAIPEEITFLKEHLENIKEKTIHSYVFYIGMIKKHNVVLVKSGVGKVMAGMIISEAVNNFSTFDKIINLGVAGGYGNVQIGDIIVGKSVVYGDVDVTYFQYSYGQVPTFPPAFEGDKELLALCTQGKVKLGTLCTTDMFMNDIEEASSIVKKLNNYANIMAFDMESCAFAQAAYYFGIPFLALRAISDVIGSHKDTEKYNHNLDDVAYNINTFVLELIKKMW